jgi:hypothetical protein
MTTRSINAADREALERAIAIKLRESSAEAFQIRRMLESQGWKQPASTPLTAAKFARSGSCRGKCRRNGLTQTTLTPSATNSVVSVPQLNYCASFSPAGSRDTNLTHSMRWQRPKRRKRRASQCSDSPTRNSTKSSAPPVRYLSATAMHSYR